MPEATAKFQVRKTGADEFLTADLSGAVWFAPPALAYSFPLGVARALAEKHGGEVGVLTTVWGKGWKVVSRTWTPAEVPA